MKFGNNKLWNLKYIQNYLLYIEKTKDFFSQLYADPIPREAKNFHELFLITSTIFKGLQESFGLISGDLRWRLGT